MKKIILFCLSISLVMFIMTGLETKAQKKKSPFVVQDEGAICSVECGPCVWQTDGTECLPPPELAPGTPCGSNVSGKTCCMVSCPGNDCPPGTERRDPSVCGGLSPCCVGGNGGVGGGGG